MIFPQKYECLKQNEVEFGDYKIIPIRFEDRINIMSWRNEQIYHLRQSKPLTQESQDEYFAKIIANMFSQKRPKQILFSLIKNEIFIGYGGLVHINWYDKNAEISFVMDTKLEKNFFKKYWINWLYLIEQVAFNDLNFNKIYTYAFDLRPNLYLALEKAGFFKEATLLKHVKFKEKYIDVVIHSKININKN